MLTIITIITISTITIDYTLHLTRPYTRKLAVPSLGTCCLLPHRSQEMSIVRKIVVIVIVVVIIVLIILIVVRVLIVASVIVIATVIAFPRNEAIMSLL